MKPCFPVAFSLSLIAASFTLIGTSCSFLKTSNLQNASPSRAKQLVHQRISQLHFGQEATFALCVEPACPSVTPKTIADATPMPIAVKNTTTAKSVSVLMQSPEASDERTHTAIPTSSPQPPEPHRERVTVHFIFGSARLTSESKHALDRAIQFARKSDRILISGRTDNSGPTKANNTLALARALSVREYIRDKILDVDNTIAIDAKGSCCFVASNDTSQGRQENRRVEVIFNLRG